MKRIISIIVALSAVMMMLISCGEEPTPVSPGMSAEEWGGVFADSAFNNVTLTAKITENGENSEMMTKVCADGSYVKISAGDSAIETYLEYKDGKTYIYAKVGEDWIRTELGEEENDGSSALPFDFGELKFESFTYSEAEDVYVAEKINIAGEEIESIQVTVKGGKVTKISMIGDGETVEMTFTAYGTTEIEFPEVKVNEGESGDIELPIVPFPKG